MGFKKECLGTRFSTIVKGFDGCISMIRFCIFSFFCKSCIYLSQRQKNRERERQRSPIYSFTSQRPALAKAKLGQTQELRTQPGLPTWMGEMQLFETPPPGATVRNRPRIPVVDVGYRCSMLCFTCQTKSPDPILLFNFPPKIMVQNLRDTLSFICMITVRIQNNYLCSYKETAPTLHSVYGCVEMEPGFGGSHPQIPRDVPLAY